MSDAPVVLLWGPDAFPLRQAAVELFAVQGFHPTEIEGSEWQGGELLDLATPSLWGERRGLLLTGCEHLTDAGLGELKAYLQGPAPDARCVLTLVTGGKSPALVKVVQQAGGLVRQIAIRRQDLPKWVLDRAAARSVRISPAGASALVGTVGEDLAALDQAVEQLGGAFPSVTVGPEHVHAQFQGTGEQRVWDLCDRAFTGRTSDALLVLRSLLDGRDDPLLILGGIASRLRDLLRVQSTPDRLSTAEATQAAGLRFDWQLRRYREQARRYSPQDLAELHSLLVDADRALKGGAAGDVVLAGLVVTISGVREARLDLPMRVSR